MFYDTCQVKNAWPVIFLIFDG